MEEADPTVGILVFVGFLLLDVLLFGFGAAVQNLNYKEIEKWANENEDKKAKRLWWIISEPSGYINTVQLVVTLVHILMGGLYLSIWLRHITRFIEYQAMNTFKPLQSLTVEAIGVISMIVTTIILLYVLLTFGILIPKRVGAKYAKAFAYAAVSPIYYITKLLLPFTGLVSISAKGILCLIGIRENEDNQDVTEEEIISMINEGHEQGVFQSNEAEMITNIFEYGDKESQDIMIHRQNIMAIDGKFSLGEAVSFMLEERYSRFPVFTESIDHIQGILYVKDAMRFQAQKQECIDCPIAEVEGLIRPAVFIPETKNIDALFQTMQSMKIQMVMIVDEYGQTSGLVTMEDILEEIVGNILDEYDEEEPEHIEEQSENVYIIEGMTPLKDLEERFDIAFQEEEFDTLNGFLISKMEKIPEDGEEFEIEVDGYHFLVLSVENKRVRSVQVTCRREIEEQIE